MNRRKLKQSVIYNKEQDIVKVSTTQENGENGMINLHLHHLFSVILNSDMGLPLSPLKYHHPSSHQLFWSKFQASDNFIRKYVSISKDRDITNP